MTKSKSHSQLSTSKPKVSKAREQRIIYEIVVDAYSREERVMGWYCYLGDALKFPFHAKCVTERAVSPLHEGEKVEVVEMAPEDDCWGDMLVIIRWGERTLGVPLSQLKGITIDKDTKQAIEDWHYWIQQGYEF